MGRLMDWVSAAWRKWTACYRWSSSEPVIQLQSSTDHQGMMVFDVRENQHVSGPISGPIWQKKIPMGGKCQLPDFSGVIIYDSAGNVVPPKNSRLALPWN